MMNWLELIGWLSCVLVALYFSTLAFVVWRFALVGWASKYPAIITTVAASLSWYISLSTAPFSIQWNHRTGQLVAVQPDDATVERVKDAIGTSLAYDIGMDVRAGSLTDDEKRKVARKAIRAMIDKG